MNRQLYYEGLKALAREKRTFYDVKTDAFGLRELRGIYSAEKIRIDKWPLPRKIKALYMCADDDYSVAVQSSLPDEPKLFALVHELKHHYRDREALGSGVIVCGDYNVNELIEKGAEVFAAEFIYPEAEFLIEAQMFGSKWLGPDIVRFKREVCKAKVSYKFICKRLERAQLIQLGQHDKVQFRKLEEDMYGVPFYRKGYRKKIP